MKNLSEANFKALDVLSTIKMNEDNGTVVIEDIDDENKLALITKILSLTGGNVGVVEKETNRGIIQTSKYRYTIKTEIPFDKLLKKVDKNNEKDSVHLEDFEKELIKKYFKIRYKYDGNIELKSICSKVSEEGQAVVVAILSNYGFDVTDSWISDNPTTAIFSHCRLSDSDIWLTNMPFSALID